MTVFEVTYMRLVFQLYGLPIFLSVVAPVILWFMRRKRYFAFKCLIAVCAVGLVNFSAFLSSRDLISKYREGKFGTVEGNVKVTRSDAESDEIQINGQSFTVTTRTNQPRYKVPSKLGGVLSEGKHVRLKYIDDAILRIDVLE